MVKRPLYCFAIEAPEGVSYLDLGGAAIYDHSAGESGASSQGGGEEWLYCRYLEKAGT